LPCDHTQSLTGITKKEQDKPAQTLMCIKKNVHNG